jgi:hypothetical protein
MGSAALSSSSLGGVGGNGSNHNNRLIAIESVGVGGL